MRPRSATAFLALWLLLIASATLAVTFGPADITPTEVWATILHHLGLVPESPVSRLRDAIVWDLRLPRVIAAMGVGAGLALAGVVMQALTRNPLADPYLLGLSSGAALGAVTLVVLGFALLVPVGAFLGALGALALGAFRAQDVNAELMDADPLERGLVVLAVMIWPAVAWLVSRRRVLGACVLLGVVAVATCVMPENAALLAVAVGAALYVITRLTGDRGVRVIAVLMPALLALAPLFPLILRPFLKFFHGPLYPGAVALRAWAEETGREPLRMITGHGLDTSIRARVAGFLSPDAPRTLPFEIWYELGVVGALAAAVALGYAIFASRRHNNPALTSGIVACFGAAFTIACFGAANAQSWWLATLGATIITFVAIQRGEFRNVRPAAGLRKPAPPPAG